jgi:hypothetical protein
MNRTLLFCLIGLGLAGAASAQVNAPNHAGFPKTIVGAGVTRFSKPLVVDLDNNNGPKEIVVGTKNGKLYVFDNAGNIRAGWPQTLPSEIGSSPAAADLNGDGNLEIVVGCGTAVTGQGQGRIVAFRPNGTVLWSYSPFDSLDPDTLPEAVYTTPALGDLDGDGLADVVFGSWDFYVYALKGTTGMPLPGWPVFARDTVWSSPALADLDGDGNLEIIVGLDSHVEGPPIDTPNGGAIYVYRKNGSFFPGFPQFVTDPAGVTPVGIHSSPAVGDIDGDGCPEIVVGTGNSTSTGGKRLHAWNHDGSIVAGWPVTTDGHPTSSPALANLDADPELEVIATDDAAFLYGLNGNGTQIFKMKPKAYTGASAVAVNEPVAAQVGSNPANNPAILVGGVGFDVTLISKAGAQISENGTHGAGMLIYSTGHPVPGVSVADLDNDGGLDIIAASGSSAGSEEDLGVYVWTAGSAGAMPWPQFHNDPRRNGRGTPTGACALPKPALDFYTLTPCRVADSRQPGNTTYGGPAYVAGEQRTITFTGVCGIPATAKSVSLNVTITGGTASGLLRLFPGGDGVPTGTAINWTAGQTRGNNIIVPLSFDGRGHLTVQAEMVTGQVHVILDVNGYFQ